MGKVQVETDIPQTVNYVATSVTVGATTTLNPGQQATVTNSGTEQNAIFNFGIPRGESAYEQAVAGGYTGSLDDFEALLAQLSDVLALMPKSGGTFTGDVTMDSGTSINFAHTKFYENNADNIVIGDGNGNGLVIMPNGQGAALFYNNGLDYTEVITGKDVKDTYSSTSSYPVSGKAVALAVAGKQDTISDLSTIRSGATAGATAVQPGDLATVATTGSYNNLTDTPNLADVATSGDYDDLINKPTIPTNLEDLSNVTVTTPSDGDGLVYDAVADKWKNGSFTASAAWGAITGTLSSQTDLKNALDGKEDTISDLSTIRSGAEAGATAVQPGDLATVATSGQYSDLTGTPTVPSAIDDLSDVNITSATDGQVLSYDNSSSKWVNTNAPSGLPSQTGQSGKFLTTDGTDASWAAVDALPAQTGQSGKYLTTDGSSASWASVDALPSQTGQSGKYLTTDGTDASWTSINVPVVRNIGEIVPSILPLSDAGLHLLDGDLLSGSGAYGAFVDYIGDLYDDGNYPDLFETEANWQTAVSAYGVCGKFVYDSVNDTVRLPKITGIIEGTIDATALGDLVEAGLPNITGTIEKQNWQTTSLGDIPSTGALSGSNDTNNANTAGSGTGHGTLSIDASKSSSIYGNSNTVQPQTIKGFYYIVVANSVKTEIQVDIDQIATDLNGKANTGLSNLTDAGSIKVANLSKPTRNVAATSLSLPAANTPFYAPADGYYCLVGSQNVQIISYDDNGNQGLFAWGLGLILPVSKGQMCRINYTSASQVLAFGFVYATGAESEAS